jgi:histidinol-phosphate aminotransferase
MDARIRSFLRADWDRLEEYHPVKPLDVLAAEIGVAVDDLVKLDANENLHGPIPEVLEAVRAAPLHIYPDPGQTALRAAIAAYAGCDPAQVVAGSGADDLIDVILRVTMPAAVVDNPPTFGMYPFLARLVGARVIDAWRTPGFALDIDACRRAVRDEGARVVFVTSPNNPTGNPVTEGELRALLALDALIVLDEAYVEFAGSSFAPWLADNANLVILRTFSKWAGLAGLRVGYALCHPDFATCLMAAKQPYNVNVAGEHAALAALAHRDRVFESVRALIAERDRLSREVGALGWLRPFPSQSNFVLFEVEGRVASQVAAALRSRGVLVRYYQRPGLENYIRISAGRPQDTDRLLAALRELEAA